MSFSISFTALLLAWNLFKKSFAISWRQGRVTLVMFMGFSPVGRGRMRYSIPTFFKTCIFTWYLHQSFVLFSLPQQVTFADEVLVLHQLWQLDRKVSRKHQVSCLKTVSKVENKTKLNYQKNVALKFRSIVITLSFWTLQVNMAVLNKFFHSKFLTLEYRWSNNLSWGLSCG